MKFLVGTAAHNAHIQHIVGALAEAGMLHSYVTGGVDHFPGPSMQLARAAIRKGLPGLNRRLSVRALVDGLPTDRVQSHWRWELPRVIANGVGAGDQIEDWLWERGELALDRTCARRLRDRSIDAFLGVEHGALASITAARALGKTGFVVFLSPHHRTYSQWVEGEFERDPSLGSAARTNITALTAARDARRDEEASAADWIVTGSSFTTGSLVAGGFDARKILTVPLAGPDPVDPGSLPTERPTVTRILYVGPLSVRKGAHRLLRVWRRVARRDVELHCYGKVLLPAGLVAEAMAAPGGDTIFVHGSVGTAELSHAYRSAGALVLPTLCDGYGLVVSEALAHGLPVITTCNAGAADAIEEGRTGFVIDAGDDDALVDRLQWCTGHPGELMAMRPAVLAGAARRTWKGFRAAFQRSVRGALSSAGVERVQS